jgi:hypothetical protein
MVNRHGREKLFKKGDLVVGLSREESIHKDIHQERVSGKVFEIISVDNWFENDYMITVKPLSSFNGNHSWFQGRFKKL